MIIISTNSIGFSKELSINVSDKRSVTPIQTYVILMTMQSDLATNLDQTITGINQHNVT